MLAQIARQLLYSLSAPGHEVGFWAIEKTLYGIGEHLSPHYGRAPKETLRPAAIKAVDPMNDAGGRWRYFSCFSSCVKVVVSHT